MQEKEEKVLRKRARKDKYISLTPPPEKDVQQIHISRKEGVTYYSVPIRTMVLHHWIEVWKTEECIHKRKYPHTAGVVKPVSYGYYLIFEWYVPDEEALRKI